MRPHIRRRMIAAVAALATALLIAPAQASAEKATPSTRIPGTAWLVDPRSHAVVVVADRTVTGARLDRLRAAAPEYGSSASPARSACGSAAATRSLTAERTAAPWARTSPVAASTTSSPRDTAGRPRPPGPRSPGRSSARPSTSASPSTTTRWSATPAGSATRAPSAARTSPPPAAPTSASTSACAGARAASTAARPGAERHGQLRPGHRQRPHRDQHLHRARRQRRPAVRRHRPARPAVRRQRQLHLRRPLVLPADHRGPQRVRRERLLTPALHVARIPAAAGPHAALCTP